MIKKETIDLSELNIFDTAKAIIKNTKYSPENKQKFIYKISSAKIENILKEISITNIELVS